MGHRGNLGIITSEGRVLVTIHNWCVFFMGSHLFWGPDAAENYIRKFEPEELIVNTGEYPGYFPWYGMDNYEGGAVLDHQEKRIVFECYSVSGYFLYHSSIPEKDLFLNFMNLIWEEFGYKAHWTRNSLGELEDLIGVPQKKQYYSFDEDEEFRQISFWDHTLKPYVDIVVRNKLKDGAKGVMSIQKNDQIKIYPTYESGLVRAILMNGESNLDRLSGLEYQENFSITSQSENWPNTGAHFNFDTKEIDYWSIEQNTDFEKHCKKAWPDWKIINHGHDYQIQNEKTEGRITFEPRNRERMIRSLWKCVNKQEISPHSDQDSDFYKEYIQNTRGTVFISFSGSEYDGDNKESLDKEVRKQRFVNALRKLGEKELAEELLAKGTL